MTVKTYQQLVRDKIFWIYYFHVLHGVITVKTGFFTVISRFFTVNFCKGQCIPFATNRTLPRVQGHIAPNFTSEAAVACTGTGSVDVWPDVQIPPSYVGSSKHLKLHVSPVGEDMGSPNIKNIHISHHTATQVAGLFASGNKLLKMSNWAG